MSIDPTSDLIPVREVVKIFPRTSRGKRIHASCIYRYMSRGCRGVRLEFVQTPYGRMVSRAAVARFLEELTKRASHPSRVSSTPSPKVRQQVILEAEKELAKRGI